MHAFFLISSLISLFFSIYSSFIPKVTQNDNLYTIKGEAQGTTYLIKYIYHDSIVSKPDIDEVFLSIDSSLSLYKDYSTISLFNASVKGIKYTSHFYNVVQKSIEFYNLSSGTFDITCKPLSSLWGFGKNITVPPSSLEIASTLKIVGSNKIYFSHDSLIKRVPAIQLDCDGIAQGYTVDVIYSLLVNKGIANFMVEVGGEIRSLGYNQKTEPWAIGIETLNNSVKNDYFVDKVVLISNKAITTSGNYRKFKKLGSKYFSHIIDPKIGRPVNNGIISVSVIADDAVTADALDNALMVMGIVKSFKFIQRYHNIGFNITYVNKDGFIADTSNNIFKQYLQ